MNEATTSGSEKKNPHCGAYRKGAEPVRSCRPSLSGVFDKGEKRQIMAPRYYSGNTVSGLIYIFADDIL